MDLEAVNRALAATVRKQEADIKAADAEMAKLRKALRHYANANNWGEIPGENYKRVWLEPYTSTRESCNGYDLARNYLGGDT